MSTLSEDLAAIEDEATCLMMRMSAMIAQVHDAKERAREDEGRDERQLVMEMAA